MKRGDMIGAAAVQLLVELKRAAVKGELLQAMLEARNDYNYSCNGIAFALQPFVSPQDAQQVATLADSIQHEITAETDKEAANGFTRGAAVFLAKVDLAVVRAAFLPKDKSEPLSEIRARILCSVLMEHRSTAALDLSAELLARGVDEVAFSIYFIANFAGPEDHLSWLAFSTNHVDRLVSTLGTDGSWALSALRCLCIARPDLTEFVRARASKTSGILKAALLYCAHSIDAAPVFEALSDLGTMT